MALQTVAASALSTLAADEHQDLSVIDLSPAELGELASPVTGRIVSLTAAVLGEPGLRTLAGKSLPRLRKLTLAYCALDPAGMTALGASALARPVRWLTLGGPSGGAATIGALTATPLFAALEQLDFYDGDLGDDGCAALAEGASRGKLRRLALGRPVFGAAGDASNGLVGCKGVARLVAEPALAALEDLGVSMPEIDAELARALLGSPLARFVYLFPGSWKTRREAPTGGASFTFQAAHEMPVGPPGGAFFGTTTLSTGLVVPDSGGSGIFSADGLFAALPIWQKDAHGKWTGKSFVRLITLASGASEDLSPSAQGSLALYSFEGGKVRGIANLEDAPAPFEAQVPASH